MTDNRSEPHAKFMTNIASSKFNQTMYIKWLKYFTPNPRVSVLRLALGALLVVVIGLLLIGYGVIDYARLKFLALPIVVTLIPLFGIGGLLLLSTTDGSMLYGVLRMLGFFATEEFRRRKSPNSSFDTVGIESIRRDGVIRFGNGDVGALYATEGSMSLAILPSHAQHIIMRRKQYLIARGKDTQETLLTSIVRTDVTSQVAALDSVMQRQDKSPADRWAAIMAKKQCDYLVDEVASQSTIQQHTMLREKSMGQLEKYMNTFETYVAEGMLSQAVFEGRQGRVYGVLSEPLTTAPLESR